MIKDKNVLGFGLYIFLGFIFFLTTETTQLQINNDPGYDRP